MANEQDRTPESNGANSPVDGAQGYAAALAAAVDAARVAGAILRAEFERPAGPRGGQGKCPADTAADQAIRDSLLARFPGWALYGEELGAVAPPKPSTSSSRHVWLVDPNDGTSAFLRGQRGTAVSIALLRDGEPVLGVVFASTPPVGNEDLFAWADGCGPLRRNGQPIDRQWPAALTPEHTILVSQSADNSSAANADLVAPARFHSMPSIAYRLALVAAGDGEVATSLNSPVGYDYAAGHALLRGVGGELVDQHGEPIRYTADGESSCHFCFGGAEAHACELARRGHRWHEVLGGERDTVLTRPSRAHIAIDRARLDRAQGCLLGQLAGDALGGLVEFQSAANIRRQYPDGVCLLADGGTWNTLAGQPTDDSEMALGLARSLVHQERFDREEVARAYGQWLASRPFDRGGTIAQALSAAVRAMRASEPVADAAEAAAKIESQANGALMRVSPLCIFGSSASRAELAGWVRSDARLTHPHIACQDANVVFAAAIRECIRTASEAAASGRGQHRSDPRTSARAIYDDICAWAVDQSLDATVCETLAAAAEAPPEGCDKASMGWVLKALQNAFYRFLHAPSLEAGVVDTIMLGGDTDTNAAIAGALLGALHGATAVPAQWRDRLLACRPIEGLAGSHQPRPREYWPVDALILAERLLVLGERHADKGNNAP